MDFGSRIAWNGGYGPLFERIMRNMCEYNGKSLQHIGSHTDLFVGCKLAGGVYFHARPGLGVRQCKISRSSAVISSSTEN